MAPLNFKTVMRNSPQGENSPKPTIARIKNSHFNEWIGKGEGGIGLPPTCFMATLKVKFPVDILYHSFSTPCPHFIYLLAYLF